MPILSPPTNDKILSDSICIGGLRWPFSTHLGTYSLCVDCFSDHLLGKFSAVFPEVFVLVLYWLARGICFFFVLLCCS